MGLVQKDALRTTLISYTGLALGYVNKGLLFLIFLTTEQIGLLNLLVAVGTLFGGLAGLGSPYALWRFFPFLKNKEKKHHGLLALMLIMSLAGGLLFLILSVVFHPQIVEVYNDKSAAFVHYYYWIIPIGFSMLLYTLFDTFLRGLYYNIVPVLVYEVGLRLVILLLLLLFAGGLLSFDLFLVLHCLAYFIPPLCLLLYTSAKGELHLSFRALAIPKRFRRIILSFGLMSYINSIGALTVVTIDAMMVAGMLDLQATGVYTMVIFLTSALIVPYKAMLRISSPLVADYWKERNMTEMSKLYKKFSSVNLVIGIAMFLLVWICREEIFHFLKPEYHEGIWVFLFLMIGRLTDMYMGLNGTIFVTSRKYRYDIIFTVALMGIVAVLNLVLIPVYGITGSAIATGVAYLVYNLGRMIFVWIVYRIHPFESHQLYILVLFGAVLSFFELVPLSFSADLLSIAVKWCLLGILFLAPIYFFKWEPEIVNYVDKGFLFVKKKLKKP